MHKKIFAALTAFLLAVSVSACGGQVATETGRPLEAGDEATDADSADENDANTGKSDGDAASSSLSSGRPIRDSIKAMGPEGTWTIFVYLCGADLESTEYAASIDIAEMMDSSANDDVRFVVQTGGSEKWYFDEIDPMATDRFVIANGEMEHVWSDDGSSMGDSETLSDFLQWGIAEYPANHMGLVLWDHGGGSVSGVCFDELYGKDGLLLKEVDAALFSVYDQMTMPFDFIGFDACLMSTAEAASLLATHANYMIASQEIEPGSGWNYTRIGDYLARHPDADGLKLGKVVCDSFYDDCESYGKANSVTLSVTDLSKIDAFIAAFDRYAEELYEISETDFPPIARSISKADNFGGNNRTSGYTNMVDTAGIIKAGEDYCASAADARAALKDAVVYQVTGKDHKKACGLSMYYPLQIQGSDELSIYKDIALSAYYLGLADRIAYGAVNGEDVDNYENSGILSLFGSDYSGSSYSSSGNGSLTYFLSHANEWDYTDSFTPGSDEVTYDVEPYLDEDGVYGFVLSEASLERTDYVEALVYSVSDDLSLMVSLGMTGQVDMDWDTGTCTDIFDGCWFSLPDGQPLAVFLNQECDGYDIYLSPILLNGKDCYLRFSYDYTEDEVTIIDIWDGIDDSGSVGRDGTELQPGDEIVPVYECFVTETLENFSYEGDPVIYDEDMELEYSILGDGIYAYLFSINDIYGNYAQTDATFFGVEGDTVTFGDILS